MEGLLKKKLFLFSVLLNVSFLVFAIASCSEAERQKKLVAKEMYDRLEAEEKSENAIKEQQGFQGRIDSLQKLLEEEKASHELTRKALLEEELVSKAIKEELNKVTKTGQRP